LEILGVDGCRAGWVGAIFSSTHLQGFKIVTNLEDLFSPNSYTTVWIDMPIRLPSKNESRRQCDVIARNHLGKRASTIFSPPRRQAICCDNYVVANFLNRDMLSYGISKQSWNISSKIRALDDFLRNSEILQGIIHESHPELCFSILTGKVIMENKKKS
jgi:predicted RNase H-like nuclease